jgi:uncharacterized protein (TIGR02466 family)
VNPDLPIIRPPAAQASGPFSNRSLQCPTSPPFSSPAFTAPSLNDLAKKKVDYAELHQTCDMVAEDDEAGQEWCEANGYPGYTSYASLDDLPWRMPIFGDLEKALDKHVAAFCKDLGFDLATRS